ncbi:hypothetical protein [Tenacibaculum mesophilum]|uniref:hypothetical protein n=1 Tax=Tenacibaculum mesophilum TaxID=104268 RepID=UPI003F643365
MPKKLRQEPIYIAPNIIGCINNEGDYNIIDETNLRQLSPFNIDDKIYIYEKQVKKWFLDIADNLIKYKSKNKGFIVLMICISYLEGVEQYRQGTSSNNNSFQFFKQAIHRIYPQKFTNNQLSSLYKEARCGLFHDGMTRSRVIINNSFQEGIQIINADIKISPSKFLNDIKHDFQSYLNELKNSNNLSARNNFDSMYTLI